MYLCMKEQRAITAPAVGCRDRVRASEGLKRHRLHMLPARARTQVALAVQLRFCRGTQIAAFAFQHCSLRSPLAGEATESGRRQTAI